MNDFLYPEPDELLAEGHLAVTPSQHQIYWHEYGTPDGDPVMFLHGGPGGGTKPKQARFFNPRRYRIVMFDQRGCGKSLPSVATDPQSALEHNTTDDLIADIKSLRKHRNIAGPMHVFGGSWGSTLALAYAIKHPENVRSLILRGIFLCRKKDLDYLYQGNAATYASNPLDTTIPGTYHYFPEPWKEYVEAIAPADRADMVKAYAAIFEDPTHPQYEKAAVAWSAWEGITSYLTPDPDWKSYADPAFAKVFARIENHYFMSGAFLKGHDLAQNYLLENAHVIARANIPVYIVHGRYDQVCPRFQADELAAALRQANPAIKLTYEITLAGHSQHEPETAKALTRIMDSLSRPIRRSKP